MELATRGIEDHGKNLDQHLSPTQVEWKHKSCKRHRRNFSVKELIFLGFWEEDLKR